MAVSRPSVVRPKEALCGAHWTDNNKVLVPWSSGHGSEPFCGVSMPTFKYGLQKAEANKKSDRLHGSSGMIASS